MASDTDAREHVGKRRREMPRDWPEYIAERCLQKLVKADSHEAQVDVIARYLLFAYMKGRG